MGFGAGGGVGGGCGVGFGAGGGVGGGGGALDCRMGTCSPLIAIAAWRATGSGFAVTRYATVPSPWPFWPDVSSTQAAWLLAVHVHSRDTPTDTVPVPPEAVKLDDGVPTEIWQRVAVGPVTVVFADNPPHAAAMVARTQTNRRGAYCRTRHTMHGAHQHSRRTPEACAILSEAGAVRGCRM